MNSSIRSVVGVLLAVLMSVLAGCGGGGGGDDGPALVSIQITPAAVTKAAGLTQQYTAVGSFDNGVTQDITASVSWRSADTTKVIINAAGLATAVNVGEATITASSRGKTSNTATLTVSAATLVSIQLTPASATLPIGLSQRVVAQGLFTDASLTDISGSVTWASSNAAVAPITVDGFVKATTTGTTNVTATFNGVASATSTITVTAAAIASITISPAVATLPIGLTQPFTVAGVFTDGTRPDITSVVTWRSSDAAKATIDAQGRARAVAAGTSAITAILNGVTSNAVTFTVTPAQLLSIVVTPGNAPALIGATRQYTATGTFTDATTPDITSQVSWQSGNTAIATISMSGLATGVSSGSATIRAMLNGIASNFASFDVALVPATMTAPRAGHTAQLLPNGKVLLAGGRSTSQIVTASAELYDPATNTFSATGPMTTPRAGAVSVLLANGRVLMIGGGLGNPALASCEIYDPSTGTWTPTGYMHYRRNGHQAVTLPDGKILAVGGLDTSATALPGGTYPTIPQAEVYDPATGVWTETGSLPAGRWALQAILLGNGKVLTSGGFADSGQTAMAELYDPATGVFTSIAPMLFSRTSHSATLLTNGQVLMSAGGGTPNSELFDPNTSSWHAPALDMQAQRIEQAAVRLTDGKVLVVGGRLSTQVLTIELFDPATSRWSTVGSLSAPRSQVTATLLSDGHVLIAGGANDPGPTTASSELY
ncbi:hypothetical protein BH09PSE6_BH09PSE6_03220 [soil metagenome]